VLVPKSVGSEPSPGFDDEDQEDEDYSGGEDEDEADWPRLMRECPLRYGGAGCRTQPASCRNLQVSCRQVARICRQLPASGVNLKVPTLCLYQRIFGTVGHNV
jgi:hypothetical protein